MPEFLSLIETHGWIAASLLAACLTGFVLGRWSAGRRDRILAEAMQRMDERHQRETEALLDGVKIAFGDISADSFKRVSDQFLRLAQTTITTERQLQDQTLDNRLGQVTGQIEKMQSQVRAMEQQRATQLGELAQRLAETSEAARQLFASTHELKALLQSSGRRGQWGERLAEDLLQRAGFVERVNYLKQATIDQSGGRPDFTFLLGDDRVLHMDVKFPFENWIRMAEAGDEAARKRHRDAYLRDVRRSLEELAGRGYQAADPRSIDLAILFIPNEPAFIAAVNLEPALLDEAGRRGVALASPFSLLAILVIVREAAANLNIARESGAILAAIEEVRAAWVVHVQELRKVTRTLAHANKRLERVEEGEGVAGAIDHLTGITGFRKTDR